MSNNYTLGKGRVRFSTFQTGTKTPVGFRYLGNTPELNLSIEGDELKHYSAEGGIREQDDSVMLEVNRSMSLITDNISPENVALFFLGDSMALTQAVVASATETLVGIKAGMSYFLGVTASNPAGLSGIDPAGFGVATNVGATALVEGTDYVMDFDTGLISFLPDSVVAVDDIDIDVTYAVLGSTRTRVISGSQPIEGAMNFITDNPKGTNHKFYMPHVKLSPAGDYALKGEEWQQIPLTVEVLKPPMLNAIYRDGFPVYA